MDKHRLLRPKGNVVPGLRRVIAHPKPLLRFNHLRRRRVRFLGRVSDPVLQCLAAHKEGRGGRMRDETGFRLDEDSVRHCVAGHSFEDILGYVCGVCDGCERYWVVEWDGGCDVVVVDPAEAGHVVVAAGEPAEVFGGASHEVDDCLGGFEEGLAGVGDGCWGGWERGWCIWGEGGLGVVVGLEELGYQRGGGGDLVCKRG